jgi:hypothetical protein
MQEDDMARRRPPSDNGADVEYGALQNTSADESAFSDYDDAEVRHASIVDFSSVALYMPGLQTTLALVVCCLTSILVSLASAAVSVSAVRTATLTMLVGGLVVCKPIRIAYARGIDVMFDALRPAVVVYVLALIFEQLVHSCGLAHDGSITLRHWAYHAFTIAMASAGFVQAWNPLAQTDYPFVVVSLSLVAVACFTPPPLRAGEGPLCEAPAMAGAVERFFRALLFGCTYCTLAYASEPARHSVREIMLCAVRATTGSVWILCVHRFLVGAAVLQALLVLWSRLKAQPDRHVVMDSPIASTGPSRLDAQRAQPVAYADDGRRHGDDSHQFPTFEHQCVERYVEGYDGDAFAYGLPERQQEGAYCAADQVGRYSGVRLSSVPSDFLRVEELHAGAEAAPPPREALRVTLGASKTSLRPAGSRGREEVGGGVCAGPPLVGGARSAADEQRRMELVARQLAAE